MLRSIQDGENYSINATDGEIGHITDFYFDDDACVIRYLIVNAQSWLARRDVLISPICVKYPLGKTGSLSLSISRGANKKREHLAPRRCRRFTKERP